MGTCKDKNITVGVMTTGEMNVSEEDYNIMFFFAQLVNDVFTM